MAEDETSYESLKTSLSEDLTLAPHPEQRRSWHPQQKMAIVEASKDGDRGGELRPWCRAHGVARRYGISTGVVYTWRKQLLTAATDRFIRCEVVAESAAVALPAPDVGSPPPVRDRPTASTLEVKLPGGTKLRLGRDVDPAALARVLDVLRR